MAAASSNVGLTDLPTELRVKIAEYALSYEYGLCWRLNLNGRSGFRPSGLGTKNNKVPFNAFCRVSRQFWNDTRDIPFKVNAICIESLHSVPSFVRACTSDTCPSIRSASSITLSLWMDAISKPPPPEIHEIATIFPESKRFIQFEDWGFPDEGHCRVCDADYFVGQGYEVQEWAQENSISKLWHIRVPKLEAEEASKVRPTGMEEFELWMDKGVC
ncbi:hypothetical protein BDV96DRAFT_676779 [Lophiotrema nucula]|uniref:Uncharacterized protein n=1 Tax=Lophiotrema nucula TaxID=690887 RepID=A0A6A5YHM2_9PLEO|nr:hypothetical protein BDV96DRAFT_676779 [Lophiotrema nucula]